VGLLAWIIAEAAARTTLELLTRRCPKCGREQAVPREKLLAEVKCGRCGAAVPPKPPPKR